jgi:hypothetical protein
MTEWRKNVNNREQFESKWEQIRQVSSQWWSLFSDEDLNKVDKAPVKRDKYVTMLQVKYGYTREFAREEVSRRIAPLRADVLPEKKKRAVGKSKAGTARKVSTHG